jgi:hypothetical protein
LKREGKGMRKRLQLAAKRKVNGWHDGKEDIQLGG